MTIETKRRVAKGLQLGLVVGVLVGLSGLIQTAWLSDPIPALAQTVTVDSTQSPLVVNALADLANLTPTDGQSVIIKTGTEKGLWYYDKDSVAVVDSVAVLTGPGSVGRFLVINNDAGSVAAATPITAAQIDNDVDIEFGVFDADSPRSLTLEELKKTGVQVVNVLQYGADPTGVASSTTAFDDAIDAAVAADAPLYIPSGSYTLTAWVQKAISGNLTVFGDGMDITTITGPDPLVSLLLMNEGASIVIEKTGFVDFADVVAVAANTGDHSRLVISECSFTDCTLPIADAGTTLVLGFSEFRFKDSVVTGCDNGIRLRANQIRFAEVTGNIVDTISNSAGCSGITLSGDSDAGCEFADVSHNKIRDIASSGSTVETHGIIVYGRAVQVTHNRVENVGNANGVSDEGIYTKSLNRR